MAQEDLDMLQPISKVAKRTGVSVNTIRAWARDGELQEADRRETEFGPVWYTTIRAVQERLQKKKSSGRPVKLRKTSS